MASADRIDAQSLANAFLTALQSATVPRSLMETGASGHKGASGSAARVTARRPESLALRTTAGSHPPAPALQPPDDLDRRPVQIATYVYQPGMDIRDQHQRTETDAGMLTGDDVRSSSLETASAKPDASPPAAPQVHWGHLIVSDMPSSPSPSLAEMKRGRLAATLGYDRETLEHIERHTAAVSLIGSRF